MKRRDSIKTIALSSLGASLFMESCYNVSKEKISRSLKNMNMDEPRRKNYMTRSCSTLSFSLMKSSSPLIKYVI